MLHQRATQSPIKTVSSAIHSLQQHLSDPLC
jgi:hypothetical protein